METKAMLISLQEKIGNPIKNGSELHKMMCDFSREALKITAKLNNGYHTPQEIREYMLYFFIAVLVCVFVAEDFRSGYAKNLFTVRAKKSDYVISKTLVCIVGAALMLLAFFIGSMLGGAISGLSFNMDGFGIGNVVMCVLSKMLIVSVFVPIYLIMSVAAKQKLWLSLLLSFMVGMFLFMMIPMLTPLNSTIMNVVMCLAGGLLFSIGLGAVSNTVLKRTSLV